MAELLTMQSSQTVMDSHRMSEARRDRIGELLKELRMFQRRAKAPEDVVVWAEISHEVEEMRKRWERAGLINGQEELPLAAEAPGAR